MNPKQVLQKGMPECFLKTGLKVFGVNEISKISLDEKLYFLAG